MRKTGLPVLMLGIVLVAPLTGQSTGNERVIRAMSGRYQAPLCPLKGGDFRTAGAATYLKTATEGVEGDGGRPDEKKRLSIIGKAQDVSIQAIQANPKNAAAWYYLGRAYLLLGDLPGADSAFTKTVELSPDCAEEVKGFRQKAWTALVMPTTAMLQQQKNDSALALLRDAAIISRDYPQGFFNEAVALFNLKQYDSAAVYFKLAQEKAGNNPQFAKDRANATYNLASLLQQLGRSEEAVTEFQRYLTWMPNDVNAKKQLASALRLVGRTADAAKLEQELLASSGTAGGTELSSYELMSMGNNAFQAQKYDQAVDAYQKLLAKEPGNRDGLYNLANAYFALGDWQKLLTTSKSLLAVDPMNEDNHKLLGKSYTELHDTTNLIKAYEALYSLPISVNVTRFAPRKDGAKLSGTATGRDAQDMSGKTIPPAPVTLVFEFVDSAGTVVGSQEVGIPALQANTKQDINVDVTAPGIVTWRYHRK